jgi:ADP-ribose pyrophosphatase YjhB (NUDIX family)
MNDPRMYPDRPFLAVSAAIIRDGRVLIARRAKGASTGVFTLPGGVVEAGEALHEAVIREVREETGIAIEPVALAGQREFITRDESGRVSRHFVILCFACSWVSGEGTPLLEELSELRWLRPAELSGLKTTEGLAEIVESAFRLVEANSVVIPGDRANGPGQGSAR